MKKILSIFIVLNIIFLTWPFVASKKNQKGHIDVFCESTLKLNNDRNGSVFTFDGTIVSRFKPDLTGYIGMLGVAEYNGKTYNVSREVNFIYSPKDDNGIYNVELKTVNPTQADNISDELVENNITGHKGITNSYVLRRANNNTSSIGNIYTPIVMCVDKLN